jgi:hypothetical protein
MTLLYHVAPLSHSPAVTQKELTALCRAQGSDQSDRSKENLARAHDALTRQR